MKFLWEKSQKAKKADEFIDSPKRRVESKGIRKQEFFDLLRKIENIRQSVNEVIHGDADRRAEIVREKMRRVGIKVEVIREMLRVLEEIGFGSFTNLEIERIKEIIDSVLLEVDPTHQPFYLSVRQKFPATEGEGGRKPLVS